MVKLFAKRVALPLTRLQVFPALRRCFPSLPHAVCHLSDRVSGVTPEQKAGKTQMSSAQVCLQPNTTVTQADGLSSEAPVLNSTSPAAVSRNRHWIRSALLLVILLGAAAGEPVWADRGHHAGGRSRAHVGVVIGAPLFWPHYPPTYYYPPVMVAPASPPVYIEQEPLSPQQYWYFCNDPQGYYPYVKQCPSGWQQVTPPPQ